MSTAQLSPFEILYDYYNIPDELCSICSMDNTKGEGPKNTWRIYECP